MPSSRRLVRGVRRHVVLVPPDKLVKITDKLYGSSTPASESFATLQTAPAVTVLRGVSFTPGT